MRVFLTGDTHGTFGRIGAFCDHMKTTKSDILIILGDAGINYEDELYDRRAKEYLEELPITIFSIHGNHERRPYTLYSYHEKEWHGGRVYVEDEFPSLLFAKDGEIYDINGLKTLAIGGAYSVDKYIRIAHNMGWWADEQPSQEIRKYVEKQLTEVVDWKVDVVLTHTTPLKYEPTEAFLPFISQSMVDKSTEMWLDTIEDRLCYQWWFCGHYHIEKQIGRLRFMFEDYAEFPGESTVQKSGVE